MKNEPEKYTVWSSDVDEDEEHFPEGKIIPPDCKVYFCKVCGNDKNLEGDYSLFHNTLR